MTLLLLDDLYEVSHKSSNGTPGMGIYLEMKV